MIIINNNLESHIETDIISISEEFFFFFFFFLKMLNQIKLFYEQKYSVWQVKLQKEMKK